MREPYKQSPRITGDFASQYYKLGVSLHSARCPEDTCAERAVKLQRRLCKLKPETELAESLAC